MKDREKQTQAELNDCLYGKGVMEATEKDKNIYTIRASGKMARNCLCDGAVEIRACFNYNGSGGDAFGGAKEWPALNLHISFQEGEVAKRDAFVQKLQELIEKELS